MGTLVSRNEGRRYTIFLNISFLFLACVFLIVQFNSAEFLALSGEQTFNESTQQACELQNLDDYKAKCMYLKSTNPCVTDGYIDYLYLLYCHFGKFPFLGQCLLFLWLLVLFYLLGNTASEYFCPSLENLSRLLKLSPTISGVTLLALGNGAPDVFSSLVSVMGSGTFSIGYNTVLGGASFVSCVVVGSMSILVKQKQVRINKGAFSRDVGFFLFVLAWLVFIFLYGKINLWSSIGFFLMYIVYVVVIYISHVKWTDGGNESERDANSGCDCNWCVPILSSLDTGMIDFVEEGGLESDPEVETKKCCFCFRLSSYCSMILFVLEMPLYLPRRLTIPVVCQNKWSKPVAVASVTLAPLLLSALFSTQDENATINARLLVYGMGLLFGVTFGILAYMTTKELNPPNQCLLPWLAGGFLMSVTWSYITARELIALLVSLGYIFEISPSILGLTFLAWGNSLGDLITNLTMALKGGPEGAQVALSGCYAGPIFNILFGLGLSLVVSSWQAYPSSLVIPTDVQLLETLGFLAGGLLWALVVLPRRNMKLDGVLGGGLLAIYFISVSLRLFQTLKL